jgi:hypothetical protein
MAAAATAPTDPVRTHAVAATIVSTVVALRVPRLDASVVTLTSTTANASDANRAPLALL